MLDRGPCLEQWIPRLRVSSVPVGRCFRVFLLRPTRSGRGSSRDALGAGNLAPWLGAAKRPPLFILARLFGRSRLDCRVPASRGPYCGGCCTRPPTSRSSVESRHRQEPKPRRRATGPRPSPPQTTSSPAQPAASMSVGGHAQTSVEVKPSNSRSQDPTGNRALRQIKAHMTPSRGAIESESRNLSKDLCC